MTNHKKKLFDSLVKEQIALVGLESKEKNSIIRLNCTPNHGHLKKAP